MSSHLWLGRMNLRTRGYSTQTRANIVRTTERLKQKRVAVKNAVRLAFDKERVLPAAAAASNGKLVPIGEALGLPTPNNRYGRDGKSSRNQKWNTEAYHDYNAFLFGVKR